VEEGGSALGEGPAALGARFGGDLAGALVAALLRALHCGGSAGAALSFPLPSKCCHCFPRPCWSKRLLHA
jgi:hypothetical protein